MTLARSRTRLARSLRWQESLTWWRDWPEMKLGRGQGESHEVFCNMRRSLSFILNVIEKYWQVLRRKILFFFTLKKFIEIHLLLSPSFSCVTFSLSLGLIKGSRGHQRNRPTLQLREMACLGESSRSLSKVLRNRILSYKTPMIS